MIKRDVFLDVGRFTTDYFMYSEDIDLCYKVSQKGWKSYHVGQARVIHHGGRSSGANPDSCFEAVTTRESALRYMRLRRGNSYAALYRLTTAMAAMVRLAGLGLAFLFAFDKTRRRSVGSSITKWTSILLWTLGFSNSSNAAGIHSSKAAVEGKKDVTGREAAAQS
jgi:GT2 family glycosyltransferase